MIAPNKRAAPAPLKVVVPATFSPARILKVVEEVVPADIVCDKRMNTSPVAALMASALAARALTVESWNSATTIVPAAAELLNTKSASMSSLLDDDVGVIA